MTIRIGINGFGRIGRTVTRILHNREGVELVGINDLTDPAQLAHLLKYDSVYRGFPGEIGLEDGFIRIGDWKVRATSERDPAKLDWKSLDVDFVVESTGVFRTRETVSKHLEAGAKRVILSVPPKDALDATVVRGVNDEILTGSEKMVSNASCTTNAAAPLTSVIHEAFGIQRGYLNTIHAYTNDQSLKDQPHSDWRRARSAPMSIIPTTTGAAKAVTKVIPELAGRLDGVAYRVPITDGSIVDMVFQVEKSPTVDEVNKVVREAAEGKLKGILQYTDEPLVSVDIIGNPHSSIYDSLLTQVIDGHFVKVASWYDNEFGYSNRLVEVLEQLARLG